MEERPKRKPMRLAQWDYRETGYYFITICAKRRKEDVFCFLKNALGSDGLDHIEVQLTPAGKIVDQLIQNIDKTYQTVAVDIYCIMPDHIHLLLKIQNPEGGPPWAAAPTDKTGTSVQLRRGGCPQPPATTLSKVINSLKTLSTKRFGAPLWQRGYYDHILRNPDDLQQTRRYIQTNPLKQQGGNPT